MNLELSEEQNILNQSVGAWLQENYSIDTWRKLGKTELGYSAENWAKFAEMGWLGLPLPETHGGAGGEAADLMILAEQLGGAIVVEPYLSTVVLGAGLIELAGTDALKAEWLPRIAEGQVKLAFAVAEPGNRYVLNHVSCSARKQGDGYLISGKKAVVLDAPSADKLIVLARTAGAPGDAGGLGLFLVDPNAEGVALTSYRTLDRRRASDILFDNARAEAVIGDPGNAWTAVEEVVDRALAFLAAEAVGTMEAALATTSEYVKVRKQFGSALGDFQVVQHRLVDMRIQIENARSLAVYATLALKRPVVERRRAAAAAKSQSGRSGRFVGQQSIQLHGGMGMTDEMSPGHYMKRLMVNDILFGNSDYHERCFADLSYGAR